VGGAKKFFLEKKILGVKFFGGKREGWFGGREDAIAYIFHEMRVDSGFDFGDSGRSRLGISLGSGCKV